MRGLERMYDHASRRDPISRTADKGRKKVQGYKVRLNVRLKVAKVVRRYGRNGSRVFEGRNGKVYIWRMEAQGSGV